MKFKQFLNEESKKEEKYEDIFRSIGISLNDYKHTYPYDIIYKDKNYIGSFNYSYLNIFDVSVGNTLNREQKIYWKDEKTILYSNDIINPKLKKFSEKNNLDLKLIGPYKIDEKTKDGSIGGLVVIFKKSYSKHVKQLKFEAVEPGQKIYEQHDRYFIKLTNQKEVDELQNFLNKNHYGGSQPKEVYPRYKERYGRENNNFAIYINIPEERTEWDTYNWYNNQNEEFGKGYSLEEFKDIANEDTRIKVKF